jgi:hypothetical protein
MCVKYEWARVRVDYIVVAQREQFTVFLETQCLLAVRRTVGRQIGLRSNFEPRGNQRQQALFVVGGEMLIIGQQPAFRWKALPDSYEEMLLNEPLTHTLEQQSNDITKGDKDRSLRQPARKI